MSVKCGACGLVSFGEGGACRRCGAPIAGGAPAAGGLGGSASLPPAMSYHPPPLPSRSPPEASGGSGKLGCLAVIVMIVVAAASAYYYFLYKRTTPDWRAFSPPDGRFTVSMPAQAKEAPVKGKGGGPLELHYFVAEVGGLGATGVGYYDLSKIIEKTGTITPPQREKIMDAMSAGLRSVAQNAGATLVKQNWTTIEGNEGIEAEATIDDPKVKDGRMALEIFWAVPDRIYILTVAGIETGEIYTSRARFFSSFALR